jgi:hypothetical protein
MGQLLKNIFVCNFIEGFRDVYFLKGIKNDVHRVHSGKYDIDTRVRTGSFAEDRAALRSDFRALTGDYRASMDAQLMLHSGN